MRCQPFGFVFHRNTEDFPKFSTLASPKMLMHLSTSHFLPRHPLHHVLTFLVLAQRLPRHLVIGDGFNLPPLAQLGIALILPARRQQRAVHEVVLELARGHGIPYVEIILLPVLVRAVSGELQACIRVVVGLNARKSRALPQADLVRAWLEL